MPLHVSMFVSERRSVVCDSLRPHGLQSPWNSPGQNTGVGCHFLLQGIFPTQRRNPGLLHCRWILYHLSKKSMFGLFLLMRICSLYIHPNVFVHESARVRLDCFWFAAIIRSDQIRSVAQSCPTLRSHESQHARPPCRHQLPEFTQTHIH